MNRQTVIMVGAAFGAVALAAATQIEQETEVTGLVDHWVATSCNNAYYSTDCATEDQGMKYYAQFTEESGGVLLDVSAQTGTQESFEALVSAAFSPETHAQVLPDSLLIHVTPEGLFSSNYFNGASNENDGQDQATFVATYNAPFLDMSRFLHGPADGYAYQATSFRLVR